MESSEIEGVVTTEVRETHRFDVAALERYMREHVEGFRGPVTVRQFHGGQSNPTYYLESPGGKYVLRRKPPGRGFFAVLIFPPAKTEASTNSGTSSGSGAIAESINAGGPPTKRFSGKAWFVLSAS